MPKTLSVDEKLVKYNITKERYKAECAGLLALGFTQQQADKMILKKSSKNSVEAVLLNYRTLSQMPYYLTNAQIVSIASNDGGAQALRCVVESFEQLQALGFSATQIVSMASNGGGAQAIRSVLESFARLQALGFSATQIVSMASNDGGAQALRCVVESFAPLQALGFSATQIVSMASNIGGAQAIKTVIAYYDELCSFGYDSKAITALASRMGARGRLNRTLLKDRAAFFNEYVSCTLPAGEGEIDALVVSERLKLIHRFCADFENEQVAGISDDWEFNLNDLDTDESLMLVDKPFAEPLVKAKQRPGHGFFAESSSSTVKRKRSEEDNADASSKRVGVHSS